MEIPLNPGNGRKLIASLYISDFDTGVGITAKESLISLITLFWERTI
jgi:hypothetical protein